MYDPILTGFALKGKGKGEDFPGNHNGAEEDPSAPPEAGSYFLATAKAL